MKPSRKLFFILLIGLIAFSGLSACSAQSQSEDVHLIMAPMEQMPAEIQSAPVTVQEAYQFSVANPDIMDDIPCYCGCGNVGHTSNYDCYVSDVEAQGNIRYDNHALGCSICVDITWDVMRMLKDGKSTQDALAYINTAYARYGPSNIP